MATRLVAAAAISVVSMLTFVGAAGMVFVDLSLLGDTSCPDPAQPSSSVFGDARWSRWPPGPYCDYRQLHPDWPESVALRGQPSRIRAGLLIAAPLTSVLSAAYLWSAIKRYRRRRALPIGEQDDVGYRSALTAMQCAEPGPVTNER